MNAWLRDHARDYGANFLDYYGVLIGEDGSVQDHYAASGGGLSEAGYAALEPVMLSALTAPDLQPSIPQRDTRPGKPSQVPAPFRHLDSNTRRPRPFIKFAGKPGATHYGVPFDSLGFLNRLPSLTRTAGETRIFVVGDSTRSMVANSRKPYQVASNRS